MTCDIVTMISTNQKRAVNDCQKYWDRQICANSVDPDQTALKSSLIRVCSVCHMVNHVRMIAKNKYQLDS